jgi:hypothetical protein
VGGKKFQKQKKKKKPGGGRGENKVPKKKKTEIITHQPFYWKPILTHLWMKNI